MRKNNRSWLHVLLLALVLGLAGCVGENNLTGNTDEDGGEDPGGGDPDDTVTVSDLDARASDTRLGTASSRQVEITAVAKDAGNRIVEGVDVSFTATSGNLTVVQGTTDGSGQAIATLSPGDNPRNRTITVTASVGSVSESVSVDLTGTTLAITGPDNLALNDTGRFTIELSDSEGNGIADTEVEVTSAQGNPLSSASMDTDPNGQVLIDLTANNASASNTDTIEAEALGLSASKVVNISSDSFVFTSPAANSEIPIDTAQPVSIEWTSGGNPQSGEEVTFSTSRGVFSGNGMSSQTVTTDVNGAASVSLSSATAGPATITATTSDNLSATTSVEFVATTVASLELQASSTHLQPGSTVSISATVRDPQGNLVKDAQVSFSLNDPTGGSLLSSTDVTNSSGEASTIYQAGNASGRPGGVTVEATVIDIDGIPDGTASDFVNLTVGGNALRVTLGTGNELFEPNTAQYYKEWVVTVTDADSNAVANEDVQLSVIPLYFHKGYWTLNVDDEWVRVQLTSDPGCLNEDNGGATTVSELLEVDRDNALNGTMDAGEDADGDGQLEPSNVATVPSSVTTDASGSATFRVTYAQDRATWVDVRIIATITSEGSEFREFQDWRLDILAADTQNANTNPPGNPSPFGSDNGNCTSPE